MDDLIGKYAYKKYGFFSHLVGKIEKSDSGITPYKITFSTGGSVGFRSEKDIVVVEDIDNLII